MKPFLLKCSLALLVSFPISLSAEVSYMAKIVSDYVFEGITQTDTKPALQGYVEYAAENGFYIHTWASNVDFGEDLDGVEIDLYLGYEAELNDYLTLDTGYVKYFYIVDDNNLTDYEYAEIFANLTIHDNTTVYLWLADDEAVGGQSKRFKLAHTIPLSNDFNLNLAFHTWRSEQTIWDTDNNDENGDKTYHNYLIGLSKEFHGTLVDLSYSDTNIKNWQEAEKTLILTISRTFE